MIKKLVKFGLVLTLVISSLFMYAKPLHAEGEELKNVNFSVEKGRIKAVLEFESTQNIKEISISFNNYYSFSTNRENMEFTETEVCLTENIVFDYIDFDEDGNFVASLYSITVTMNDDTIREYLYNDAILDGKDEILITKEDHPSNKLTADDFKITYYEHPSDDPDYDGNYFIVYKGTEEFVDLEIGVKDSDYENFQLQNNIHNIKIINNPALDETNEIRNRYPVSVSFEFDTYNQGTETFTLDKDYRGEDIQALLLEKPKRPDLIKNLEVNLVDNLVCVSFNVDTIMEIYQFIIDFENDNGPGFGIYYSSEGESLDVDVEFDYENNKIVMKKYLPEEVYEYDEIKFTMNRFYIYDGTQSAEYTKIDKELEGAEFEFVNHAGDILESITAEDIKWEKYYEGNDYIELNRFSDQYYCPFRFKYNNIYFDINGIADNPAYDENISSDELTEVSVVVQRDFKGKLYRFLVEHVPAKINEYPGLLRDISLNQNGNKVELQIDHEKLNDIVFVDAKFVNKNISSYEKEFNYYHYFEEEAKDFTFDLNDYYLNEKSEFYLSELTIRYQVDLPFGMVEDVEEVYSSEITKEMKDCVVKVNYENPYSSIEEKDIKYYFNTVKKYLMIDKDTKKCHFENMEFVAADNNGKKVTLRPRIAIYDSSSENDIFNVSVKVQTIFGDEVKEYQIDNIPAKFETIDKGITQANVRVENNQILVDLGYNLPKKINHYNVYFVSVEDPTFEFGWTGFKANIAPAPVVTIGAPINPYYFPEKASTYKVSKIELMIDDYDIVIDGNNDLLKDLTFTLDPKDSEFYNPSTEKEELFWYFKKANESLKIQKGTGIVDYKNIVIENSIFDNSLIKNVEIMNNPGLDENSNENTVYKVDAVVTYKTRGGFEAQYILKDVPAKVIVPIGEVVGRKTAYEEEALPYLKYYFNDPSTVWSNREAIEFTINMFDGSTKKISVRPSNLESKFEGNGSICYIESTTYYDVGLEYIFKGTVEDTPFLDKYTDFYFANKKVVYLVDENRNIVDTQGNELMKYKDRPKREYVSNNENIELNSKEGSLPSYTEINAVENDSFDDVYDNYVAYDMSLDAKGEEVQPADAVQVGITVPSDMDEEGLKVVYIDENGNPTDEVFDVNVENGVAYFETTHFSTYALVATNKKQEVIVPEIDENSDLENLNITVDGQKLVYGKDYEVSVKETITGNIKLVEVTIHFIGEYANLKDVVTTYEMSVKEETNEPNITVPEITEKTDLDNLVIKDGDKVLVKDKDYTITKIEKDGQVTVTITFIGDYAQIDPIVKEYPVTKGESTDTSDSMNIMFYVVLMVLSLIAMLFVRRKHQI